MKKSLVFLILFLQAIMLSATVERNFLSKNESAEGLKSILLLQQKWVPYPLYEDRAGWDKLMGSNKQLLIKRGEKKLDYEWKVIKATDFLEYERSGNRNVMQDPNVDNDYALNDLVLAELAEGKGRFIDQIINGVFYNCERTSWALSAHLTVQKSHRVLPDVREQIIDLGSSRTGAYLSWVYFFFHKKFDTIDPTIAIRLQSEIYNKIIIPYRTINTFWWMAFNAKPQTMVNNWNPWCNSNVLQCILLLENDPQQMSNDVYRTMISVDKFINYIKEDGACEEGPSYWEHAAGKLYDYLQLLYWATDSKVSLFEIPMIKNMGEYISRSYIGNDWVVNFADASAKFSTNASLIYRYGKALKSTEMMQFAASLSKAKDNTYTFGDDLFRSLESVYFDSELKNTIPNHSTPEVIIYPETQFYYFKNKAGFFAAIKGGHNAESHNHNDVGTFSLWYNQSPVIIDAGVGTYTRQTFGSERYSIWTMRSIYHNLPEINGEEQKDGRQFKTTDIVLQANKKAVSFNIASAYPIASEAKVWTRSYQLKANEMVISDKFELENPTTPNVIHLMLPQTVELTSTGKVYIQANDKRMELAYNQVQFTATLDTIELPDIRLSSVWGKFIHRLTLNANNIETKATYSYSIKPIQ